MKTIKKLITAVLRKEYRLAVWNSKGRLLNFKGKTTLGIVLQLPDDIDLNKCTWTLYKTGRFYLPEREVQRSDN